MSPIDGLASLELSCYRTESTQHTQHQTNAANNVEAAIPFLRESSLAAACHSRHKSGIRLRRRRQCEVAVFASAITVTLPLPHNCVSGHNRTAAYST